MTPQIVRRVVALVAVALVALLPGSAQAQPGTDFGELDSDQRIYDATGTSLTPGQIVDLRRRVRKLRSAGADPVILVRALQATPDETLAQVEALQQTWVRLTGADQDTAIAVLINRNPADPEDARAGVFAGRTFKEGNLPLDEQTAIVEDALIPPLRDGDVHASLAAGLDRLTSSIRNGPPRSGLEQSRTWAWADLGVALACLLGAMLLFRRRQTTDRPEQEPTTTRPGDLPPVLAGALAGRGTVGSDVIPAVILDLATRGALAIEPEGRDGGSSKPKVQIRLLDPGPVRDEMDKTVWSALELRAADNGDHDVLSSRELARVTQSARKVRRTVKRQLHDEGWLIPGATGANAGLPLIGTFAFVLAIVSVVPATSHVLPIAGLVALAVVSITAFVLSVQFSPLSRAGHDAAIPWRAYRMGLERAAEDQALNVDLDDALPYIVAFNLRSKMEDRLKAASSSGKTLRAFASGPDPAGAAPAFPYWTAFVSSTPASRGSGSGTVSGGGAGGGGGAAGST